MLNGHSQVECDSTSEHIFWVTIELAALGRLKFLLLHFFGLWGLRQPEMDRKLRVRLYKTMSFFKKAQSKELFYCNFQGSLRIKTDIAQK